VRIDALFAIERDIDGLSPEARFVMGTEVSAEVDQNSIGF
jgi:hypothetical protein